MWPVILPTFMLSAVPALLSKLIAQLTVILMEPIVAFPAQLQTLIGQPVLQLASLSHASKVTILTIHVSHALLSPQAGLHAATVLLSLPAPITTIFLTTVASIVQISPQDGLHAIMPLTP